MLLAKVQELQNSIPELEVKCDNLAEKESQLRELIERLETEKNDLVTKQTDLTAERDNLLTRCEEFTQTIYEYDVQKITMAGKMEELQNKLEVNSFGGIFVQFVSASLASLSFSGQSTVVNIISTEISNHSSPSLYHKIAIVMVCPTVFVHALCVSSHSKSLYWTDSFRLFFLHIRLDFDGRSDWKQFNVTSITSNRLRGQDSVTVRKANSSSIPPKTWSSC